MRKIYVLVLVLFIAVGLSSAQNTTLTGTISGPAVAPTFNGVLQIQLYQPGSVLAIPGCGGTSDQYIVPTMLQINISAGGLVSPPNIWGADCLQPAGIPYKIIIRDLNGNIIVSDYWLIEGAVFDVGQAQSAVPTVPSTNNGSMVYPPAGIPNSLGASWGTSYLTTGGGNKVMLSDNPAFTGTMTGVNGTLSGSFSSQYLLVGSLTPGNCVQAGVGGALVTTSLPCGSGGGGGGNVTTSGLTAPYIPVANGTYGLQNSSISDNGSVVTTTLQLIAPSFATNGSGNGFMDFTSQGVTPLTPGSGTVRMTVPNSVTAYQLQLPGSQPPDSTHTYFTCTNANPSICDWGVGGSGADGNVSVNGGSAITGTANFNNTTPAAEANALNIHFQQSSSNISGELVGDGNAAHYLDGTGHFTTPAGSGIGTYFAETITCTTTCTLAHTPTTFINLARNGVDQRVTTDFSVSSATVTLVVAASGGDTFYAQYFY